MINQDAAVQRSLRVISPWVEGGFFAPFIVSVGQRYKKWETGCWYEYHPYQKDIGVLVNFAGAAIYLGKALVQTNTQIFEARIFIRKQF